MSRDSTDAHIHVSGSMSTLADLERDFGSCLLATGELLAACTDGRSGSVSLADVQLSSLFAAYTALRARKDDTELTCAVLALAKSGGRGRGKAGRKTGPAIFLLGWPAPLLTPRAPFLPSTSLSRQVHPRQCAVLSDRAALQQRPRDRSCDLDQAYAWGPRHAGSAAGWRHSDPGRPRHLPPLAQPQPGRPGPPRLRFQVLPPSKGMWGGATAVWAPVCPSCRRADPPASASTPAMGVRRPLVWQATLPGGWHPRAWGGGTPASTSLDPAVGPHQPQPATSSSSTIRARHPPSIDPPPPSIDPTPGTPLPSPPPPRAAAEQLLQVEVPLTALAEIDPDTMGGAGLAILDTPGPNEAGEDQLRYKVGRHNKTKPASTRPLLCLCANGARAAVRGLRHPTSTLPPVCGRCPLPPPTP